MKTPAKYPHNPFTLEHQVKFLEREAACAREAIEALEKEVAALKAEKETA